MEHGGNVWHYQKIPSSNYRNGGGRQIAGDENFPQATRDITMYTQATHKTPTRQGQKINTPHSTHS